MKRVPWVNFVASQPLGNCTTTTNNLSNVRSNSLCGDEISAFYRSVVRESNEKSVPHKPRVRVVQKRSVGVSIERKPIEIFKCAEIGDVNGIQECLSQGIDINHCDSYGWTPLMCASCAGQDLAVKCLLKNGANVEFTDRSGRDARSLALHHRHTNVINCLKKSSPKSTHDIFTTDNITDETSSKMVQCEYFCDVCQTLIRASKVKHESSIIHNLNSNNVTNKTVYQLPNSNVGYQMMLRSGWDEDNGLGPSGSGNKYPIKTLLKQDRRGLGNGNKKKPRVTHFKPFDVKAVQRRSNNNTNVSSITGKTMNKKQRLKQERKARKIEIDFRREFNS